jgi:DnaJ homolog subfamily B member 12
MPSFSRRSPGFAQGNGFEGEVSPEELFNMFFGGGGFGGGGFGGGPSAYINTCLVLTLS